MTGLPISRGPTEIGYHSKDYPTRKLALGWYDNCKKKHAQCNAGSIHDTSTLLPERILDIGEKGEKIIRLHLRDKGHIRYAPYATVSYCWGDAASMKLTADTFATLVSGIPPSSLPKTFRNAIALVREFGIRYLWIDSLCILQDSSEDWQQQGAVMGQIYKSCALCLAATSATDCNGGLFFERDPYLLQPVHVLGRWPFYDTSQPLEWYTCFVQAPYSNNIMLAPLNSRGWVLQERLLAPRVLHCTEKELIWECNEIIASETFPSGIQAGLDPNPTDRLVPLLRSMTEEKRQDYAYNTWMRIVKEYSGCIFTKENDILIALSGIAQEWQMALGDVYLAGLWKKTLHVGLLWYTVYGHDKDMTPLVPRRPTLWRAPTWSWASINGQVQWSRDLDPQLRPNAERVGIPLFELLQGQITTSEFNITGQVYSAFITIRGFLLQASVDFNHEWFPGNTMNFNSEHGVNTRRIRFQAGGLVYRGVLHLDDLETLGCLEQRPDFQVTCLPLLLLRSSQPLLEPNLRTDKLTIEGLVLDLPSNYGLNKYERIGHFKASPVDESPFHGTEAPDRSPWEDCSQDLDFGFRVELTLI